MQWEFLDSALCGFEIQLPDHGPSAAVLCRIDDFRDELPPEECEDLAPMAPARQIAFASGRHCAHVAQRRLGLAPTPIRREARLPVWPHPLRGSITHSRTLAGAVVSVAHRGVGMDIERTGRVTPKLHRQVLTPQEQAQLDDFDFDAATLIFSAKEAAYKAIHPIAGKFIGFHEAEVHLDPERRQFQFNYSGPDSASAEANRGSGYWREHDGHVLTLFVIGQD